MSERDPSEVEYNASSIQVLEGLEAVRKRPAMYIGDVSTSGLHHLLWEVIDNSVDEALQRRCDSIQVTLHKDGSASVLDNGAGIPTDLHPKVNRPALEVIMTKLHAGGKFDKGSYQVSGGLHGVGVSVVNALSEWLEVEVYRDGKAYRQTFARGRKTSEMETVGPTDKTGTLICFKPDPDIFEVLEFQWAIVHKRLRELAYLMGTYGLRIDLEDERTGQRDRLHHPGGLIEFVKDVNKGKNPLHEEPIYIDKRHTDQETGQVYEVECAMQYHDGYNENVFTFVNNIHTIEGGTHLSGFKSALTRSLNLFAKSANLLKDKQKPPSGEDLREGLTAVLSIKVPEPKFESQTKIRLGNREVESIVMTTVGEGLRDWLEEHPRSGAAIFNKALDAARAREAARRAREQVRRKSAMESSNLPFKLADCHKGTPRDEAELFLVEGDSAGGSAITGRAGFQAILPLRGKILNVEKAPVHKVVDHKEIEAIVSAIGTGFIGDEFDESRLRYGKIIIMTDADVDGSHIRTLLLTFFYRKMPELVRRGYIYVAQPPLYFVKKGKIERYVHDEKELAAALLELGAKNLEISLGGRSFTGAELVEAVNRLQKIKDHMPGGMAEVHRGLAKLIGAKKEGGNWPTHRISVLSERLRVSKIVSSFGEEEGFFLYGGEAELQKVLARIREEVADVRITFFGEKVQGADLIVRALHFSSGFLANLHWFEERGVDLSVLDAEDGESIEIRHGSRVLRVRSWSRILAEVQDLVRGEVVVKRFKGLGEMEPSQLWESTMDPERRLLYRVELSDAMEADTLFTVLMGSLVEPRRRFIQQHALEVEELDI